MYIERGRFTFEGPDMNDASGHFVRSPTQFHDLVSREPGAKFPAERGRYRLYAGHGCPWAHRTLIYYELKKLEGIVERTFVAPFMARDGWYFEGSDPPHVDPLLGASKLHEIYTGLEPDYTGRITIPVLVDTHTRRIVNNESAEIIRMFNSEFDALGAEAIVDLYPADLRAAIDEINDYIYERINNGVYRCGFAKTQKAYDDAFERLFEALDRMDDLLGRQAFLCGERVTEADLRFFPTLVRFDVAYYGIFKCNRRRIKDYVNLWPYLKALYQTPGIASTCNFHAYRGYYTIPFLNPRGILPRGPEIDLTTPHDRPPVRLEPRAE